MRTRIIKIGNSRGIRIPKPLLDQTGITDDIILEADMNHIIIRPVSHPREGWETAFRIMSEKGDDSGEAGGGVISHSWDDEEWQW